MDISIKPIKPKKISDQAFDQIRELIYRGKLKPGDKILAERELAKAMQVSRSTVRDAIQRLVSMGLVVQKQGQGTFVKAVDSKEETPIFKMMQIQDATIDDLLEVRLGLECNAAAMAARRADGDDIKAMDLSIEEMKKEIDSGRLGTAADTSFHMAIAYAAKNPLQILIMRNFYDYLFHGIRTSLEDLYMDGENIDSILKQHIGIIHAIKARDSEGAQRAMNTHIDFVVQFYRRRTADFRSG
ncbi:MAG: FadR/GntR family transcriptional regulator [Desulfobacterium sp.]|nr:FadR/GntR family transcriptional regulator [Desulfobacterium sp.]